MRQTAPGLLFGVGSPVQAEDQSSLETSANGVFRVWLVLNRKTVLPGMLFHSGRENGQKCHSPVQSACASAAALHHQVPH